MKLETVERVVVVGGGASPYRATGLPEGSRSPVAISWRDGRRCDPVTGSRLRDGSWRGSVRVGSQSDWVCRRTEYGGRLAEFRGHYGGLSGMPHLVRPDRGPTPQPPGKILKTELPEPYCGLGRRVH